MKIDDALRDFHSTDVREGPALLQGVFSLPLRKVGFECLHVEENTSLSINWYLSCSFVQNIVVIAEAMLIMSSALKF